MLPLALALVLSAAPAPSLALAPVPLASGALAPGERARALAQEEEWSEEDGGGDEPARKHLFLSGWGGEAFGGGGSGRASGFWGGEAAWAFSGLDVGAAYSQYRTLRDSDHPWTPVVLARIIERFQTRRGFEATFALGLGAGRPKGWQAWYQVALGVRVPLGPLFAGAELAFEQYDLLRLGGGLGVAF